jgi:outer membrane protein
MFPSFIESLIMKKQIIAAAALCTLMSGAAFAQQAKEGPWMVRVRAVHLDSANDGSTTPNLNLSINNKTIPEVDVSYFFSKNLALELVLTVPQKHRLSSFGNQIGTLKHLPPTLLAQYHFDANGFKPYVGAGINYTHFSGVNIPGADIDRNSWGAALQAGVDIPISGNMYLNLDLKKVYIQTDVSTATGTKLGTFKVDPLLVGVGLGWRF